MAISLQFTRHRLGIKLSQHSLNQSELRADQLRFGCTRFLRVLTLTGLRKSRVGAELLHWLWICDHIPLPL